MRLRGSAHHKNHGLATPVVHLDERMLSPPSQPISQSDWLKSFSFVLPFVIVPLFQTPVSHTLRKHLDNVGMLGFQDESGMMSDFGQREIAKQAAGAKSGYDAMQQQQQCTAVVVHLFACG